MNAQKILLIGAGALARDIIGVVGAESFYGCYVDASFRTESTTCAGVNVLSCKIESLPKLPYCLALSDPAVRIVLEKRLHECGLAPCSALYASMVFKSTGVSVGPGTILGQFVSIGADATTEQNVCVMHNVTLGHDSLIRSNSVLCPGVCIGGYAQVGSGVFIGANATVAPHIRVGDNAIISAGASCFRDVPSGALVIGNPARQVANPKTVRQQHV